MGKKQLPEEFKDFIKCLNSNNVKYLLVGGWAVGIYGHPRATKDIDFLVSNNKDNLNKLQKAFLEFGSPPIDIQAFREEGYVIRMGDSPTQIDIINRASGIDINDCFCRKNIINIEGIEIKLISKDDLIINKKASGRQNDLGDVEKLEYKKIKIEEMKCYKHEIKNEIIIDFRGNKINKMEIISENKNICKFDCIDKKGKNIFILQRIKDNNTERWYFDINFNKISAIEFIKQFDIEIKNKKEITNKKNGDRKK